MEEQKRASGQNEASSGRGGSASGGRAAGQPLLGSKAPALERTRRGTQTPRTSSCRARRRQNRRPGFPRTHSQVRASAPFAAPSALVFLVCLGGFFRNFLSFLSGLFRGLEGRRHAHTQALPRESASMLLPCPPFSSPGLKAEPGFPVLVT